MNIQKIREFFAVTGAWFSSSALRSYEWQFDPRYWYAKRFLQQFTFRLRRWSFQGKLALRETAESTSIITEIATTISLQALVAVSLVLVLGFIDQFAESRHWPGLSRGLSSEAQLDFLATLLQVSAGFLALYFTAISLVTSTGYAKAPGQIRYLVMQEQVGSIYFKILAQFVGVVAIMLTALSLNYHIGLLNTVFASLICLFAAFSFVVLGIRTFHFFDPIALAPHISKLILQAVHATTPAGHQWKDPSFQRHHQQRAENYLGSYSDLVTMAAQKENLTSKGLSELANNLLLLLKIYAAEKSRIPTASLWFRRRQRHKDWLLSSYHEVEIALVTGTIPQPDNQPNLLWFEEDVGSILKRISAELAARGDLLALSLLAARLTTTMRALGSQMAVSEAAGIFDAIVEQCRKDSREASKAFTASDPKMRDALAVVEGYSCALINLVLGLSQGIETLSVEKFQTQFQLKWLWRIGMHGNTTLPRKVLEECEWVKSCIDFELKAEKQILTPLWFCKERPARGHVAFMMEAAEILVKNFENTFGEECSKLTDQKNHLLIAQLVQRGLECSEKLDRALNQLASSCDAFSKLNRSKEWEWPKLDWAALHSRVDAVREKLVTNLAEAAPYLAAIQGDNLPDYFGHAYSVLADECFTAMTSGNEQRFSKLFLPFFGSALLAFAKLREKLLLDTRNATVIGEPLVDLVALSGYASLFSELDGKKFVSVVHAQWDGYFARIADPNAIKDTISLFASLSGQIGQMTARNVLRMRWQRAIESILQQRKILRNSMGTYFPGIPGRVSVHASPLIRAFVRGGSPLYTGAEHVFLCTYLLKRPEAAGIQWPHIARDFDQALKRETKTKNSEGDEE